MISRHVLAIGALAGLSACVHLSPDERCMEALHKGDTLRAKNKLDEAAEAYAEAIDDNPQNLFAIRDYVEVFHLMGRTGAAVARFKQAIAVDPNDAYAHEGLGLALFTAGGSFADQSRSELEHAVALAPTVGDFAYRLGLFHVESDRFDDAKVVLAKAVQLDPHSAKYRLPYALALARTGDRRGAVLQLQAILSMSPTADEVARAEKTATELIDPFRGFPQAAREQFEIALNWMDHDSAVQAKAVLDSLLQKYPELAIVHAVSGLASAKLDDPSRAILELRKAIELDGDLAEPRMYLGDLYFARGRPDNAQEYYEAAIERNPFMADAYKRLAEVRLRTGDPVAAAGLYRTYLLLRPTDLDAHLARAKILGDLHDEKAEGVWDSTITDFPSHVDVLVGAGRYFFEASVRAHDSERDRLKSKSEKVLRKALELDPENEAAAALLTQVRRLP